MVYQRLLQLRFYNTSVLRAFQEYQTGLCYKREKTVYVLCICVCVCVCVNYFFEGGIELKVMQYHSVEAVASIQ